MGPGGRRVCGEGGGGFGGEVEVVLDALDVVLEVSADIIPQGEEGDVQGANERGNEGRGKEEKKRAGGRTISCSQYAKRGTSLVRAHKSA